MDAAAQRDMPERSGRREDQLLSPGGCRFRFHFDGDEVRGIGHWRLHVRCGGNGQPATSTASGIVSDFGENPMEKWERGEAEKMKMQRGDAEIAEEDGEEG